MNRPIRGFDAVTVVIPTHNRRRLLARTLDSVLRQRDVDVEVVVVDDGSTDGTSEQVELLAAPNVRLIRHERSRGVSAARNAGIAAARTVWVAFVDDDDIWAPDKLRAQLSAVAESPSAAWSCVGAVHVDGELDIIFYSEPTQSGDVSPLLMRGDGIPGGGSGVLVSTQLCREAGGFDEEISILADWDFYLRLSLRSPVAAVTRPLLGYYIHLDSMYHDPYGILDEFDYLEQKYAAWPDVRMNIDYPTWYLRLIRMEMRKGNTRAARELVLHATRGSARGLGQFMWGVARWARQKLTDRDRNLPAAYHDEVSGWVMRYRVDRDFWRSCSVSSR